MDACPSLQLILRAGAGVDNVDVAHAAQRGIHVCNCPGMNATAVAELTIGLMIALDRRIVENVTDSRQGRWDKAKYSAALGLAGRTLGVIGSGNIAQAVIRIALGMQMNVICWGRSLTAETAAKLGVGFRHSPLAVAADAHVVTLHVAANAETAGLAGWDFFRAMRPGALFLNTTRGSVVDEEALLWALREKGIRAGLDVFQGEPAGGAGEFRSALAEHPNVYITHHIGAATEQAQDATALEAVRVIKAFVEDSVVLNAVVP